MLEGAFEVIDLGVQVAPEKFVAAIEEHQPDIVGFSAFLTTTMPMFKANMNALTKAGIRDNVIVMVGGAPSPRSTPTRSAPTGTPPTPRRPSSGPRRSSTRSAVPACSHKPLAALPARPGTPYDARSPLETVRVGTQQVVIGHDTRFCLIGERINPTGRRIFQDQLRAGDLSAIERDVKAQVEGGADVLDINMGVPLTDEADLLAKAITMVQQLTDKPICIDSPSWRRSRRGSRSTRAARWSTRSPPRTSGWSRSSRWSRSTTPRSSRCRTTPTRSRWRWRSGSR